MHQYITFFARLDYSPACTFQKTCFRKAIGNFAYQDQKQSKARVVWKHLKSEIPFHKILHDIMVLQFKVKAMQNFLHSAIFFKGKVPMAIFRKWYSSPRYGCWCHKEWCTKNPWALFALLQSECITLLCWGVSLSMH